jgi:hypothetical protein
MSKGVPIMSRTLIAAAALLTFPIAGIAQSTTHTASLSTPITAQQAHSLMKIAHSVEQYKQLSSFFHQEEAVYRVKAADEKTERDRRAQVSAGLYQKYPRPVDSAQALYESYVSSANSAALQARHYDQLAAGQTQHDPQLATSSQGKS